MSSSDARQRCPMGFTLIELLVVVAIIALLISILLPSLQRAKASARQLYCLSNLRSVGEAANLYGADNNDFLPRGIQMFTGNTSSEYHIFATCVLPYLGSDFDGAEHDLFNSKKIRRRDLNDLLRGATKLQCPDYPVGVLQRRIDQQDTNPVDYVSSAVPVPYTYENLAYDEGHLQWDPDDEYGGVPYGADVIYAETAKLESFPALANPAAIIYVTEAHVSLPWQGGPRLHHFFLAQQLPFAERPRIANDQRHPGGINALFFGGNARSMEHYQMDPGWPHPITKRLKWFTVLPDDYVE